MAVSSTSPSARCSPASARRPVTFDQFAASEDRQLQCRGTGLLWILAAAFFIAWLHRAYKLDSLAWSTSYGTGWAIGSWFVPILNLFRPKQIARLARQLSAPCDRRLAHTPSALLDLWWAAWSYGCPSSWQNVRPRPKRCASRCLRRIHRSDAFRDVDSSPWSSWTGRRRVRRPGSLFDGDDHSRARRWLHGRPLAAAAACGAAAGVGVLTLALQPSGGRARRIGDAASLRPPPRTRPSRSATTSPTRRAAGARRRTPKPRSGTTVGSTR